MFFILEPVVLAKSSIYFVLESPILFLFLAEQILIESQPLSEINKEEVSPTAADLNCDQPLNGIIHCDK